MTEIRFYHLERQGLEQALPALLSKALEGGRRVLVKGGDAARLQELDEILWTYHPDSFLPHGLAGEDQAADQPVLLSTAEEAVNGADVLVLVDEAEMADLSGFKLCCAMFDGRNPESVAKARAQWKSLSDAAAGHEMTYWQQGERGWEKKAGTGG